MARRYSIEDWQARLDNLGQPLTIIDKKQKNFIIYCHNCNHTFDVKRKALSTACLLREKGKYKINWCPICNGKRSVEGLNDIATVRKDLLKYFINIEDAKKYSIGCHARVKLKCPDCGKEKIYTVSNLCSHGFHCDYCSDNISLGNKILRNLCLQLPLDEYDFEFSDAWTQRKVYDCYFLYQNQKYIIEVDGRQHVMDTAWATKEAQEINDATKNYLAENNGYKIIRIKAYKSDFDYIKNHILKSELSEIFDLSNIDWDTIYKQTITSIDIAIANYYMANKNLYLREVAEHFRISQPTLCKSLRKMAKVGLCDYTKDNALKNAMKNLKERRNVA